MNENKMDAKWNLKNHLGMKRTSSSKPSFLIHLIPLTLGCVVIGRVLEDREYFLLIDQLSSDGSAPTNLLDFRLDIHGISAELPSSLPCQ